MARYRINIVGAGVQGIVHIFHRGGNVQPGKEGFEFFPPHNPWNNSRFFPETGGKAVQLSHHAFYQRHSVDLNHALGIVPGERSQSFSHSGR